MVVYSERVEMITANRRWFLLAVAAGLIAYLAWDLDVQDWDSFWDFVRRIGSHWHLAVGAIATLALAFSNQMIIELTNEALLLRAGANRKRIPLKEISSAKAFAEIVQDHPALSFFSIVGWHRSFVSQVVKSGVRVSLFVGSTEEFSSNNPDHVASMIDELARQAVARAPLESPGRPRSSLAAAVKRILPQGSKEWRER
jgi:hypothetical protein